MKISNANPLVSVIIPCYNQAHYLTKAIKSVLVQTYRHHEIIIVDDGSSDNAKEIAERFENTRYVHQDNQGLSAARNTGITHSRGEYLVFLDSDDWLFDEALETNLQFMLARPELGLVSGAHRFVYEQTNTTRDVVREVSANNYCELLQTNYIAMIATVMFKKEIFTKFLFSTSLKVCEDYEIYLHVARNYPIYQHTKLLAAYRIHGNNMSADSLLILETALYILKSQKTVLKNRTELGWLIRGRQFWKNYYIDFMYQNLLLALETGCHPAESDLIGLRRFNKWLYIKFLFKKYLSI